LLKSQSTHLTLMTRMALQLALNSASVVACAACQSNLVRSLCLKCFEKLSTRCLRQYPCAEPGNQVSMFSRRPFWRSERKVISSIVVMTVGRLSLMSACRFSRNHSQLLSFSTLTMAKAKGNNCPCASVAVAASRMLLYFEVRWVPSSPRRGLQCTKSSIVALHAMKSRLNFISTSEGVISRIIELPGLASRSFSQY
jgi:hypothetical protein